MKLDMLLTDLIGLPCCRTHVGRGKSLSLGFGAKVYQNDPQLEVPYYGEWEIGTYRAAWRVMKNKRIVIGSGDPGTPDELTRDLEAHNLGGFSKIELLSDLDILVSLESGHTIQFIAAAHDLEEPFFHIFMPGHMHLGLYAEGHWIHSRSDKPLAESDPSRFRAEY